MTVVFNFDDALLLDQPITAETLRDLIVIVRQPSTQPETTPVPRASAWTFDDDDLITWEDAEWQ